VVYTTSFIRHNSLHPLLATTPCSSLFGTIPSCPSCLRWCKAPCHVHCGALPSGAAHLPRVPDGRAGLEHCWAGLGAPVNKCQQRGKHCNQCSRDARSSRGIFGWEIYIFGFRVFNYTYWALVHTRGQVQWDGFQWMGLDDDVPIRKVLPFRDVLIARDSGSLLGTVFCGQKVLC
jgi:hypothetical protein